MRRSVIRGLETVSTAAPSEYLTYGIQPRYLLVNASKPQHFRQPLQTLPARQQLQLPGLSRRYVPSFRSSPHHGSAPEGALVMTVLKWVERSLDTRIGIASRVEKSCRADDDLSWWS